MEITYRLNDSVKIKSITWYNENKDENGYVNDNFAPIMSEYCGKYTIITRVDNRKYRIMLDSGEYTWDDDMFEENNSPKFKINDVVQIKSEYWYNNNKEKYTGLIYGNVCFNKNRAKNCCGKTAVITNIEKYLDKNCYTIDLTDDELWCDYMFEDKIVSQHNKQTKIDTNNIILDW